MPIKLPEINLIQSNIEKDNLYIDQETLCKFSNIRDNSKADCSMEVVQIGEFNSHDKLSLAPHHRICPLAGLKRGPVLKMAVLRIQEKSEKNIQYLIKAN